jgi:RNA polymerase sigma factor (sigma-70 family)
MTRSLAEQTFTSPTDLAARFVREAEPLMDALSRRAQRLALNHADAEELLQDTMLHAYSGFRTFEPGTNFRAWMFRILHNRWCSTYRSKQRRPGEVLTEYIDGETRQKTAYASDAGKSAEAEALAAFTYSDVHTAMGALPSGIREAIYFTIVAGYSYAETAAMLEVPLGTVMSRVSRGRRRLRNALANVVPVDASLPHAQPRNMPEGHADGPEG